MIVVVTYKMGEDGELKVDKFITNEIRIFGMVLATFSFISGDHIYLVVRDMFKRTSNSGKNDGGVFLGNIIRVEIHDNEWIPDMG